jgi:hypothetical protein
MDEWTEVHWAGLMDSQWADLKVKLFEVMLAETDEWRAAWKVSKLAEWTEVHWTGLTVALLVVFQSAKKKAV